VQPVTASSTPPATDLTVVVPGGIDDPGSPSGGNYYDRRLCDGLRRLGWAVHEVAVPGSWPRPDAGALARLTRILGAVPDDGLVLLDGLIASAARPVLLPQAGRLRQVVLVHMPFGGLTGDLSVSADAEAVVLGRARAVVTTSAWTRQRLLERCGLAPERVHVASPGVDLTAGAPGTPDGGRLLCVGAVVRHKGQDVLLEALGSLPELRWSCTLVGTLDREPSFVAALYRRVAEAGIADRVRFAGALRRNELARQYRAADLLVLPSRLEAFGMVVTEALAAGLPVVATAVGGVPEALGRTGDEVPGMLVPPEDPIALCDALADWLGSAELRDRLRQSARARGAALAGWHRTAEQVDAVLRAVAAEPTPPPADLWGAG
jgi:glycosyltransferase involved in cell wall biosynthesis